MKLFTRFNNEMKIQYHRAQAYICLRNAKKYVDHENSAEWRYWIMLATTNLQRMIEIKLENMKG